MDSLDNKGLHAPLPRSQQTELRGRTAATRDDRRNEEPFIQVGDNETDPAEGAATGQMAPDYDAPVPGKWPLGRSLRFVVLASLLLWMMIIGIGWLIYRSL